MQETSKQGVSATVVAGSVSTFMPTISAEDREDMLLVNLYAQRVTRAEYSAGFVQDWFSYYKNILNYLGWDATPPPGTLLPGPSRDRVVDAAMAKIKLLGSGDMSNATEWALAALNADAQALALFESSARDRRAVNFQLIPCVRREGAHIDMVLHHQQLDVSDKTTGFLFARYTSAIQVVASHTELVRFNTQLFRRGKRDEVLRKVSAHDRRKLLELKL